jgi:hypothetical protein
MVRPDRFELPTYWFVGVNLPGINSLRRIYLTVSHGF